MSVLGMAFSVASDFLLPSSSQIFTLQLTQLTGHISLHPRRLLLRCQPVIKLELCLNRISDRPTSSLFHLVFHLKLCYIGYISIRICICRHIPYLVRLSRSLSFSVRFPSDGNTPQRGSRHWSWHRVTTDVYTGICSRIGLTWRPQLPSVESHFPTPRDGKMYGKDAPPPSTMPRLFQCPSIDIYEILSPRIEHSVPPFFRDTSDLHFIINRYGPSSLL